MGDWTPERKAELQQRWISGEKPKRIMAAMGISAGSLRGRRVQYNLPPRGHGGRIIGADNEAYISGHTIFPKSVTTPDNQPVLKKAGTHQKKLGSIVHKGRWLGMPIYSLTLEERATCPRSCPTWGSCYGNNMPFSRRYGASPALLDRLWRELIMLNRKHKDGFVVRLHTLGDFYSVEYVNFWRKALGSFPHLNIFGYTGWQLNTPIGASIRALRSEDWARFSVRTSGASEEPRTIVVLTEADAGNAIVCPVETGKPANCASCALCWSTAAREKTIAFLRH